MSIEQLDPRATADVIAVADLHRTYLSDSSIVKLGDRFLRHFYYRQLIEDGLIGCTICRADGRVAGFFSYTRYPLDFMTRGLRRHFFTLAWLMLASVAARPAMVKEILLVLRMMRERAREFRQVPAPKVGEGVSLATESEYRDYVPPGGTSRMPVRLFEGVAEYFRREGFESFYMLVKPSNRAASIFFTARGCQVEKVMRTDLLTHKYTYFLKNRPAHLNAETSV